MSLIKPSNTFTQDDKHSDLKDIGTSHLVSGVGWILSVSDTDK